MRVLVTGATGFIGRSVVAALRARGDTVVAVSRTPRAPANGIETIPLDAVRDHMRRVDAVVNLAGESIAGRWSAAKKRAIRDSRVNMTRAIVEAIKASEPRPRVLVSASAVGYYGETFHEVDESAKPGSDLLASVCVEWEAEADRASEHGVRVVKTRLGIVLGAGGGVLKELLPLYRAGLGGPIGGGDQWWSWVHLDDVTAAILRALDDENWTGPVNLVAGAVHQRELAKTLGQVLGRPAFLPTPAFALRVALGDGADPVLRGQQVVARRAAGLGYRFTHTALRSAIEHSIAQHDTKDQPRDLK